MKKFTRLFSLFIAMIFAVSYMQAQGPTMNKTKAPGIETNAGDLSETENVMVTAVLETLYFSDFEDYEVGEFVAEGDDTGYWDTWDQQPGSATDAPIVDDTAASLTKSFEVSGTTDLVFLMGNIKTGKYQYDFNMFVPAGYVGYYNFQHFEVPGLEWAFDVFFSASGDEGNAWMFACNDSTAFTFTHDTWHKVSNVIDLNNDSARLYVDDVLINEWQFSCQAYEPTGTLQLGGVDFWAGGPDDGPPLYYIDDVEFIELIPAIEEPVMVVTGDNPIFVALGQWEETTENIEVGNLGAADLVYDIVVTYPDATKAPAQPIVENIPVCKSQEMAKPIADPDLTPSLIPFSARETVIHYDSDSLDGAVGTSVDYEWTVLARFPADMMIDYAGMELNKVSVYINDPPLGTKIQIYGMGGLELQPGELLLEQTFSGIGGEWNEVVLDDPLYVDGQDLWVGYFLEGLANTYVPGADEGPPNTDGQWFSSGGAYQRMVENNPDLDGNWHIRAHLDGNTIPQWLSVSPSTGTVAQDQEDVIDVVINTANLNPEPYQGKLYVRGNDEANPEDIIDVFVDVSVGVNEFGEKEYIMVYPNPAEDVLSVSSNGDLQHVRLMNSIGQVVFDEVLNAAKTQINVSNFESGVYIIQVETNVGSTTHKIIIK